MFPLVGAFLRRNGNPFGVSRQLFSSENGKPFVLRTFPLSREYLIGETHWLSACVSTYKNYKSSTQINHKRIICNTKQKQMTIRRVRQFCRVRQRQKIKLCQAIKCFEKTYIFFQKGFAVSTIYDILFLGTGALFSVPYN